MTAFSNISPDTIAAEFANPALSIGKGIRPEALFNFMREWGYYLLPKSHANSPGFRGLIVAIREIADPRHFNPVMARLQLGLSGAPGQKWETLRLRPLFQDSRPLYPGFVILVDAAGREQEFFTFGGSIEVAQREGETIYLIRSPAPVLLMGHVQIENEQASEQFAEEFEMSLARAHAWWRMDDQGFADRLMKTDPWALYLAFLNELFIKTSLHQSLHTRDFIRQVHAEQQWLSDSGRWSLLPPSIEHLLKP